MVVGLAGHIDHGKTALVQALTGVNTDTQTEEQRRGMTIDIGFAFLSENITLVDVPGHDRLVKNMVRGVAGIQMGLLVVAADDGVMPQTREHFQILRQLGISRLMVAITKIDLVDADWIELVKDDIAALVKGSPFEGCRMLAVSGVTGEGVPELAAAIEEEAQNVPPPVDRGFFRLSVDRLFTIKGFGAIVTGSVMGGGYEAGEPLEAVPGHQPVKIRGIQTHGEATQRVIMGDRAALNISNLSAKELERGEQMATPGFVATPTTVLARLNLLSDATPLKHNHPVRINIGTTEVMAKIKLPNVKLMEPDSTMTVIMDLANETPMIMGDRFVLRSFSPVATIGGGTIIDIDVPTKWKDQKHWASKIGEASGIERTRLIVESGGSQPLTLSKLARRVGFAERLLLSQFDESILRLGGNTDPWIMSSTQLLKVEQSIITAMENHHKSAPFSGGLNREAIRHQVDGDDKFLYWLLGQMVDQDKLKSNNDLWAHPDFTITLSDEESTKLIELIDRARSDGYEPDYLEGWATSLNMSVDLAKTLAAIAESQGSLVRVSPRLMFHRDTIDRLLGDVKQYFMNNADLTVADFKEITGTSRKLAVPILEFLDRSGHTIRIGNKRVSPDG